MEFVVIDTETTGSSPQKGAELIEIAGVVVRNWEIVYEESFNELIKPKRHVPIFITMLTGINNLMLEDKPSVEIVLPRFYDFVGDRVLVIQNAPFDLSFLDYFGKKIGIGELPNPLWIPSAFRAAFFVADTILTLFWRAWVSFVRIGIVRWVTL